MVGSFISSHSQLNLSQMMPSPESYTPSYPDFVVEFSPKEFGSCLRARRAFDDGEFMAPLEGLTKGPKAYTSVQCGLGVHVELNSDLVYINHSCDPNVVFDFSANHPSRWHVRALKRIEPGTALTFFYPSTEWDMAQAFDCECGTPSCLGRIQGATYLSKEQVLSRGFANPWILKLLESKSSSSNHLYPEWGTRCPSCGHGFSFGGHFDKAGRSSQLTGNNLNGPEMEI